MRKIICQFVLINFLLILNVYSQPVYNLNEEIVVTASRINQEYKDLLRNVTVIDKHTIQNFPSNSLGDILNAQIGMDIGQRGYHGIQGDISARGSSFEQVLIMIDGVKLNDTQTGHHNLDLPINLIDIERIEIMQGHGSSLYGPGAFGGVVNIITKDAGKSPFKISASAGDFGLANYELHKSIGLKNIKNLITINTSKSTGYRYASDFKKLTIYNKSQIDSKYGKFSLSLGYLDNDFGANNFYGQSPSKEYTKTFLTSLNGEITRFENVTLESKIYFRNHRDRFIYDIRKPEAFINNHETNKVGGELVSKFDLSSNQKVIIGTELSEDNITSNKLGNHQIIRSSLFGEYGNTLREKILLNFGIRGDYQSNYSLSWYPTLSVGFRVSEQFKLRSSIGKSFRTPSFTELYYYDPSNRGNPYLKPERGWSYETGYDYFLRDNFLLQSNLFVRRQSEMIDWISGDAGKHWQAKNIGKVTIGGIENQLKFSFDKHKIIYLKYAYTTHDFEKEYNYFSRYVFRYPVHKFSLETNVRAPFGIDNYFIFEVKKRREEKSYLVLDANFSKDIHKIICFARIMNIFSERYQEILGVPAPGRWFEIGIRFEI